MGIGPGAHGRLTLDGRRYATEAPRAPGAWLDAVAAGRGELARVELPRAEQATEYLLMAMRLAEGMDLERHEKLAGRPLDAATVDDLVGLGLVALEGNRLRATKAGRPVLNAILRALA